MKAVTAIVNKKYICSWKPFFPYEVESNMCQMKPYMVIQVSLNQNISDFWMQWQSFYSSEQK